MHMHLFLSCISFLQMRYECEAVYEQLLVYLKYQLIEFIS